MEQSKQHNALTLATVDGSNSYALLIQGMKSTFVDTTILATVYENREKVKGLYPGWSADIHFVRSDDFFVSKHEKIVPCGNQFEILAGNIFMGVAGACPVDIDGNRRDPSESAIARSGVSLFVSDTEAMSFHEACLPTALSVSVSWHAL